METTKRISIWIPESIICSIWRIVDYLWADEKRDFEQLRREDSPFVASHIFRDLDRVNKWLMGRACPTWAFVAATIAMIVVGSFLLETVPTVPLEPCIPE